MEIEKVKRKIKSLLSKGYEVTCIHEGISETLVIDEIKITKEGSCIPYYHYIDILDSRQTINKNDFDYLMQVFPEYFSKHKNKHSYEKYLELSFIERIRLKIIDLFV